MKQIDEFVVSELLHANMVIIGSNIRKYRRSIGVTQQTLAFSISADKCVISNLECGTWPNIKLNTLIKISEALEINLKDLFAI